MALSTTKGQYMELSDAENVALWFTGLVTDIGVKDESTRMFFENQDTGCLSMNKGVN